MSGKRFEGKNLEEAIDSAAKAFGVESFRVSYHVVLEKRGFLGGTKRVVIEAEVSGAAPKGERKQGEKRPGREEREKKAEKPSKSERPRQEQAPRRADKPKRKQSDRPKPAATGTEDHGSDNWVLTESQPLPERSDSAGPQDRGESDGPQERGGRNNRRRGRRGRGGRGRQSASAPERESRPMPEEQAPRPSAPVEVPEQGPQSEDASKVAAWCETIFRLSGLDVVARTTDGDEEISVELFGSDLGTVEEAGDYLDSLQVLANKAFTGRSIEKPIEFDAGGFKKRREEELAQRAREMAERVREEGRERTMRAMSPIERRIVHLALEEDHGVTTESRGRGFHKRVAILPAEEKQPLSEES